MSAQRPLSEWVTPEEPARAALQLEWHEVRRRVRRHRQVRVASAVVAALAVLGVVAGLALRPATLEAGQRLTALAAQQVRVADGSRLLLAEGAVTQLETATDAEVVVLLEQGRVTFDVSKRPTRRFVVKADAVEVRVVGTRFTVEHVGAHVSVEVHEGIVEVRERDAVHRLVRGNTWASAAPSAERADAPTDAPQPTEAPPDAVAAPEPEVHADAPPQVHALKEPTRESPPRPTRRPPTTRAERPASGGAPGGGAALPPVPEVTAPPTPTTPEPSAADAFANAMRARSAGHVKEAIVGFQQVCERFPSSAYAPMSAFEWGRLALDGQDDPRQAARAFERTLELATSSSLIEDALARLTEAYARYDLGSCRRVQAEYLRRFPDGPHVRGVTKACP